MRYILNSPLVIADILDGEAIILHMQTGKYFSVKGSCLLIWHYLSNGLNSEETVSRLCQRYPVAEAQIKQGVGEMLQKFLLEDLLRASDEPVDASLVEILEGPSKFDEPVMELYTDMQDLLLIDPIHEVEETGWPHKKQN